MRIPTSVQVLSAAAAIALLAGCSGSGSALPTNSITSQSHVRASHVREFTGVAPKYLASLHFGRAAGVNPNTPGPRDLAVSDFGTAATEVLDHNYALEATIADANNCPDGNFYDKQHRLYDADYCAGAVTEYSNSGTLMFTYTASGSTNPVGVTVDSSGNVYSADFGGGGASVVTEWPQGNTTPTAQCSTGLANEGIVVDDTGDVFVSGNNPNTGAANIVEFVGGLAGCNGTTLGVTLGFAGGLQIDRADNLVACDQLVGVDIIPPPYTSASSVITGTSDAFHVALNKHQGKIFIADPGAADVLVDLYPSGTPFMTLNSSNGLSDPASAATNPQ